ncbi:hypothetical protein Tco_0408394 [Tanacetum coccineum]
MSSSLAHSTVTYTSESESPEHTPLSLAYAPKYAPLADEDLEPEDKEDPKEKPSKEEEDELLAPAASTLAIANLASPSEETEPFEEDEVAPTPPSPISSHSIIPLSQTRLRRARKLVRPQTPLPPSIDVRIEAWRAAPTHPSPPPSPLSPLSSPLPMIPSPPLPSSPIHRDTIPKANLPP